MEMVEDVRFFPNCTQNTLLEDQSSSQLQWELRWAHLMVLMLNQEWKKEQPMEFAARSMWHNGARFLKCKPSLLTILHVSP
jgi:hypothetical protein